MTTSFFFRPSEHDDEPKRVLGFSLPAGGGIEEGEQILATLAVQRETALHICTKLIEYFVSDRELLELQEKCADEFLDSAEESNQIARVLETLFSSASFREPDNFEPKFSQSLGDGCVS